jgi:NADPH2:quinone reductase
MKALQIEQLGGSDVMQIVDVPTPEPRPGQVLVRVEAAGLNYSDIMIREGRYLQKVELPYLMGREFAGIVEAVTDGVTNLEVGQRVVGSTNKGAMAEHVVAWAQGLVPVPDGLSSEQAVAMLIQGITAVHCIDDLAQLQAGETILIHAAAGGVGTLAVQIAVQRGARVIGTASRDEKCDLIRELGGEAINYSSSDWVEELKALTDGRGADVILESVGGDVFKQSFRDALAPIGRLVVFGAASGEVSKLANVEILGSSKTIMGYFLPSYIQARPERMMAAGAELVQMMMQGQLKVIIGNTFPLEEAADAFDHMQRRESVGKVIIRP